MSNNKRWSRSCRSACRASSAGSHAFGLDHRHGVRRGQIVDECPGRVRFACVCSDRCCKNQLLLQLGGEWTGQLDAGGDQHVDQKYPEFGFTLGNGLGNPCRRDLRLGLGLHGFADAKTLEHPKDIGSGRAGRQEGDGWRIEQRLFQRVRCADVGLGRAGANDDAVTDPCDIDWWRGDEAGLRVGVLENIDGNDSEVERRARCDLRDDVGGGIEVNGKLVAGGALELGAEFIQLAGHRAAGDDLEFSGLHICNR